MTEIILDFQGFASVWDLHEYLKQTFGFPDYYGHNLDALWDCFKCWFSEPTVIVIRNLDTLPAVMKTTKKGLREIFQDLAEEDPDVQVVFEP